MITSFLQQSWVHCPGCSPSLFYLKRSFTAPFLLVFPHSPLVLVWTMCLPWSSFPSINAPAQSPHLHLILSSGAANKLCLFLLCCESLFFPPLAAFGANSLHCAAVNFLQCCSILAVFVLSYEAYSCMWPLVFRSPFCILLASTWFWYQVVPFPRSVVGNLWRA